MFQSLVSVQENLCYIVRSVGTYYSADTGLFPAFGQNIHFMGVRRHPTVGGVFSRVGRSSEPDNVFSNRYPFDICFVCSIANYRAVFFLVTEETLCRHISAVQASNTRDPVIPCQGFQPLFLTLDINKAKDLFFDIRDRSPTGRRIYLDG